MQCPWYWCSVPGICAVPTALTAVPTAGSILFYHTPAFPQLPSVHALVPAVLPGMLQWLQTVLVISLVSGCSTAISCAVGQGVLWMHSLVTKMRFWDDKSLWMLRLSLNSAFRQKMKEKIKNPAEIPDIGIPPWWGGTPRAVSRALCAFPGLHSQHSGCGGCSWSLQKLTEGSSSPE